MGINMSKSSYGFQDARISYVSLDPPKKTSYFTTLNLFMHLVYLIPVIGMRVSAGTSSLGMRGVTSTFDYGDPISILFGAYHLIISIMILIFCLGGY
jgi:hypothetical protein